MSPNDNPMPSGGAPRGNPRMTSQKSVAKKSSSGMIAGVVIVLALGGFAAWKFLPSDDVAQVTEGARQTLNELTGGILSGGSGEAGETGANVSTFGATANSAANDVRAGAVLPVTDFSGEAPATGADSGDSDGGLLKSATPSGAITGKLTGKPAGGKSVGVPLSIEGLGQAKEVGDNIVEAPEGVDSLALVTEADAETLEAQKPKPDHIDKALEGQLSDAAQSMTPGQRASMPTVGSRLGDADAPDDAGRGSDSVVTTLFVRDLAQWLVNSYQLGKGNAPGRTSVTFVGANLRYGNSLTGLRFPGKDPVAGRKSVLDYVYSSGMMEGLFRLYGDLFLDEMAVAVANRKQPLTHLQAADLYNLYAGLFRQGEGALRGIARLPDLSGQLRQLHSASQRVISANSQFAEALFLFEEARDAGNKAEAERYQQHVVANSHKVESTIQERAVARRALADAIKSNAGGRTPGEDSLIYLAEWVDRRGPSKSAATATAADIMRRLALAFEAEARMYIRDGQPVL